MARKKPYTPTTDAGKVIFLNNLSVKAPNHAVTLDISPATLTSLQNDAAMFSYTIAAQEAEKTYKQELSAYKNVLRDGPGGGPMPPFPVQPILAAPPTAVHKDIFRRVGKEVAQFKVHNNYEESIGEDLGIVGDEETINIHNLKPVLKSRLEDGHPVIIWQKGVADSIDIYVDRKDGAGFVFLAKDSYPDYTDTFPLPAGVESAVWDYRAIYNIEDDHVGHLSDPITVTVSGQPA